MGTSCRKLRKALRDERPLQVPGVMNAYSALMAERTGFRAIYLSGAGVSNYAYGLPDIGLTSLENLLEEAGRITAACPLPLLVDVDTGWGGEQAIARCIRLMARLNVAGVHLEDQVFEKRCGHLEGKRLVSKEEMASRIRAAVAAKPDPDFLIIARTDAVAVEGMERALERGEAYREAGADLLFPEALSSLQGYLDFKERCGLPVLANLTEFGKTPLFDLEELKQAEVAIALYPLSTHRSMNAAALATLREIRERGTQRGCLDKMQTRKELYNFLHYEEAL